MFLNPLYKSFTNTCLYLLLFLIQLIYGIVVSKFIDRFSITLYVTVNSGGGVLFE